MDNDKDGIKDDMLKSLIQTKKLFDIERGKISGRTPPDFIALFFAFEDDINKMVQLYQALKDNNVGISDISQLKKENGNG